MYLVSVILPCYNVAETLDEALESLAQQTLVDFEIIAVDDGSTDATLEILKHWGEKDKRIKVISSQHQGVIGAANLGLSYCSASFIARMDADDRSHPDRLASQHTYLQTNPGTAVVGSLVKAFSENGVREGYRLYVKWLNSLVTDEEIRREMFVESPIANPSMMIRKSWMDKMGGYKDHGWPEDYDLLLRLYIAGAKFSKVPYVLLEWRDHPNRITRTDSRYSVTNFLKAKAHYLAGGPLRGRDSVIIWGAGMMGRRLGKHLGTLNSPLVAYVDIDPKKIGRQRRGLPIIAPEELTAAWAQYKNPVILAAVGARHARGLIRKRLIGFGFVEGVDWWAAA